MSPPPKARWFHMRGEDDDDDQDWWWASTAIPLLAATTGPLANVMSIAALVTSWRNDYDPAYPGIDAKSIGFPDPRWCLALNGASLACGFVGNIFLLFNFTRRVRYIVALPMTIVLWYLATGILTGILISMNKYVPPTRPLQTYSQGFWHAVIASVLYLVSSMALMLNMLGYFLGHYPQHFELSDEQRNLILQTMMFFIWLAGGAGVFARLEAWSFADALYFCDVTILTVGFGDFTPSNDSGRGLVFPYSVGGIIILGLMVSSIHGFARELGSSHVVRGHVEKRRTRVILNSVTDERDLEQSEAHKSRGQDPTRLPAISAPFDQRRVHSVIEGADTSHAHQRSRHHSSRKRQLRKGMQKLHRVTSRQPKIQILKEERDRFDAMRAIQRSTHNFKRYSALSMSIIAFGLLWCVGAIGFWKAEAKSQGLSYFQALYFCYVSLLTIGYGDLSPKSNAGKPFFVVWSLIAVPTMTILVSDMGNTVIASFKRGTFRLGDWTILPKAGIWEAFVERHRLVRSVLACFQRRRHSREARNRVAEGFPVGPVDEEVDAPGPTLDDIALLDSLDERTLARKLALAIRRTANDLGADPPKRYNYEQWAEYSLLIRFTKLDESQLQEEEQDLGIVEWDFIGDTSPMLAHKTESEWILDRLCESLHRYMVKQHYPAPKVACVAEGLGGSDAAKQKN